MGLGVEQWTKEFVQVCLAENERLTAQTLIIVFSILGGLALLGGAYAWHKKRKGEC